MEECLGTIYKDTACMECKKCKTEIKELKKIPIDNMNEKQLKALKIVMKYDDGVRRKKKNLLRQENIKGVHLNFLSTETWLKTRKASKYQKCANCKTPFGSMFDDTLALVFLNAGLNQVVCNSCGKKFINAGAGDVGLKQREAKLEKENLIKEIKEFGYSESYHYKKLVERDIEDLKSIHAEWKAAKIEDDRIEAIAIPLEDIGMEEYLKKDYHVIEDPNYLKCKEQILEYFKEDYRDLFDCGQGYYEDEVTKIIKIGKEFYEVVVYAEINSSKQDRGDRLYWVENIDKVKWELIDKPLPKERFNKTITLLDISELDWCKIQESIAPYSHKEIFFKRGE